MLDDRLQERVSALVDGELTREERSQVERQMAESVECRRFYEQLLSQQSRLRNLPRFSLSTDLSHRVLEEIERLRPAVLPAADLAATDAPYRSRRWFWQSAVLAIGAIAATLLLVFFASRPERPGPGRKNDLVIQPTPATPTIDVHDFPSAETQVALAEFQKMVKWILIYEITVTPQGQKNKLLEGWMQKAGIPLGQGVVIDPRLEQRILASRFVEQAKVEVGAVEADGQGNVPKNSVAMLFVRGTIRQIDAVYREYLAIRNQPNRDVQIKVNLAASPQELEIFLQLNAAAGLDLAQMKADPASLRSPGAYAIRFRKPLWSAQRSRENSVRDQGGTLLAMANHGFAYSSGSLVGQAAPDAQAAGADEPSQALFIIRQLADVR